MDIQVDKESDLPLYIQIRDKIEAAIKTGELKPGDKLPPVTSLAKDIGVTQATIRRALQDLSDAGHTKCHVGRGTFILETAENDESSSTITQQGTLAMPAASVDSRAYEFAARRLRLGMSKALDDIMSLALKPGLIHFTRGIPDPAMLPQELLADITASTLERDNGSLAEAGDPQGRYALREEIARRTSTPQMEITAEQVLITNGSIQAIALLALANLESGRQVVCETPCFKGIVESFAASGHWVDSITRDPFGPIPPLPSRMNGKPPYLFYLCPYAHNPMGTNLSKERYDHLVDWCKRTSSIVIADEIFKDLCFAPTPEPSLLETLGPEQCIVISSLSKSLMTGLRIGWVISSARRIQQLTKLKKIMDHSAPTFTQGMALTLLRSASFDDHVQHMRSIYRHRRDVMLKVLERSMPHGIRWTRPDGGFSMMLELPRGYSSVALFLASIDRGLSFLPGPLFDIDQRFVNFCRLSYAWTNDEQIKEGIELLADAITNMLARPPGDSGLTGIGSYQ